MEQERRKEKEEEDALEQVETNQVLLGEITTFCNIQARRAMLAQIAPQQAAAPPQAPPVVAPPQPVQPQPVTVPPPTTSPGSF